MDALVFGNVTLDVICYPVNDVLRRESIAFDDVIVSYFVAGPDFTILPLTIFSMVRSGSTPELNALCTFTFLLSMVLVISATKLAKEEKKS